MTAIAPGDTAHMRVWDVVSQAVYDPCRLTVGLQSIGTFVDRIRMRLQRDVDTGVLPAGEWPVDIGVGSDMVTIRVCVQADLFGPASVRVDVREVIAWAEARTAEREAAWLAANRGKA